VPFAVLLVPFFAIIAAFVLIGLSQTHSSQHGTQGIQGFLQTAIANSFLGQLFSLSVKATRALVSRFAASHLKMLTAYLNGMAHLWKQEFAAMRAEAKATAAVAGAIERAIPREAKKAAAPAMRRATVADRHATHGLALGRANERALNRYRASTNARLKADAHAIDVTIPHDLAGLRTRNKALEDAQAKQGGAIKSLEDGAVDTWDWIRSHPLSFATAAFAGAVAIALARLGFGFLRCRSWQNVAKKLTCGMGGSLLSLLEQGLTGLLGMFVAEEAVSNLDTLVKLGQAVEHDVATGIHDLFNLKV
jgi:hypothetical protein